MESGRMPLLLDPYLRSGNKDKKVMTALVVATVRGSP